MSCTTPYEDFESQKLNAEEEKSLFAELASDRNNPKVRDRAARAFLGFALAQARKDFKGRSLSASLKSGLSLDDAVSAATYGLMQALDRFDHTRGFRFTTYAGWWIKKALHEARYSAHVVAVPRGDRERFVIYKRQSAQGLSAEEIAELNDAPLHDVERVLALAGGRQDPIEMMDRGETNARQASPDEELEPSVAEVIEKQEMLSRLEVAKLRLGETELKLLHDRFSRKMTVKQIAAKRGVSAHSIEEKLKSILHVLRFHLRA
jgi:RNA polymerase sigma factor (sigma-70 family)